MFFIRNKDNTYYLEELLKENHTAQSSKTSHQLLELFPKVPIFYTSLKAELGPDSRPYLNLSLRQKNRNQNKTTLVDISKVAISEGFGATINKSKEKVDWVFSLGDFIPLSQIGKFVTFDGDVGLQSKITKEPTEVKIGAPNDSIIPQEVRQHLRNFMQTVLKINEPKFYLMFNQKDDPPWTVIFNISRNDFKGESEFQYALGQLSWFFPKTVFAGTIVDDTNQFFDI